MRRLILPKVLFCSAVLLLFLADTGTAQVTSGVLTGVVRDTSGGVVPGVEVTARNLETNETRTTVTNDAGLYRIPNLPPGRYEVKAELTGFKTSLNTGILLTVGQTQRVNIVMEVGEIQETVVVTGVATPINTEEGRTSILVQEKQIIDLPLNGRNVYQLIRLAPGAINSAGITFFGGESGGFGGSPSADTVVNGVRQSFNGFLMDGVTNRNFGTSGAMFTPAVDAVSEFRLETTNFSAEFGEAGAMVTNLVTKSGTNEFHGAVWEFHRNDNLDAANFFDPVEKDAQGNFVGKEKPESKWNQFGFTLGGPVVKDHLFFFGYYEGFRLRTSTTQNSFAETAEFRDFVIRNLPTTTAAFLYKNMPATPTRNNVTLAEYATGNSGWGYGCTASPCANEIADTLKELGGATGVPTFRPELADALRALPDDFPIAGFNTIVAPTPQDSDQFMIRIDQNFNGGNDRIMGRYNILDASSVAFQPLTSRPLSASDAADRVQNVAVTHTHVFSPSIVNEARFGWARTENDIVCDPCGIPLIGFDSGEDKMGAYNGFPQLFEDEVFEFRDTVSINKGNHGMKAGFEFRARREPSEFNVGRPSYYFFDVFWFAVDAPYFQIAGVDPGVAVSRTDPVTARSPKVKDPFLQSNIRDWRSKEFSFFFNDDWKVRPNLTFNLGLRWDFYGRLHEADGLGTLFIQNQGNSIFDVVLKSPGFVSVGDETFAENDLNNFAPRIGFAWDPFGDGKSSVRGGYGIAFQSMFFNPLANSRWQMPFYSFNFIFPLFGSGNTLIYGPPAGQQPRFDGDPTNIGQGKVAPGNLMGWGPDNPNLAFLTGIQPRQARDPYVQSIFFGVQRELWSRTVVEVNYVSTLGRKLIRAEDPNRFPGDRAGFPNPLTGADEGDPGLNRLNPNFGTLRMWLNDTNSSYHSLQVQVSRPVQRGLGVTATYTWAHALDTRSGWHNSSVTANGRADGFSLDPFNYKPTEYGNATFDIRHKFSFNAVWEMPFFRGRGGVLEKTLGGWQTNAIVSLQSGPPFTIWCSRSFPSCEWNGDGWNNDRPVPTRALPKASGNKSFLNGGLYDFNNDGSPDTGIGPGEAFDRPADGKVSPLGRNTERGPGFAGVDFSLFKNFAFPSVSEDFRIQFRAEFFNIFNRPNFLLSESPFNAIGNIANPNFGSAVAAFDARQIQFGLKVLF